MINNINGIIFDADDTLINHKECEKQALQYLFTQIGEKYQNEYQNIFRPLDRNLWDGIPVNGKVVPKELVPEYRFEELFRLLDIDFSDYKKANDLYHYGLEHSVALLENVDDVMEYLYNKGYRLFVATNGLIRLQKPRITNSSIFKYITDIIISEEVSLDKPNREIFDVLFERNSINPSEAIMIGDNLEKDIQGAKNVGIQSIWYNPTKKENDTSIIPDFEISNLLELKNLF